MAEIIRFPTGRTRPPSYHMELAAIGLPVATPFPPHEAAASKPVQVLGVGTSFLPIDGGSKV